VIKNRERKMYMRCPRCGREGCQIATVTTSKGKDFSASKGCCGYIFFGPIGILCGLCGEGKQVNSTAYWICGNCGNKFKA